MELRIGGRDGFLILRSDPGGSPYAAHAEITIGDDLTVRREVEQHYAAGSSDLAEFFASLAEKWRGWRGERAWESLGQEPAPSPRPTTATSGCESPFAVRSSVVTVEGGAT